MLEYFEVGGGNQMEFSTTPAYVTHDLSNVTPQCVKLWTHIAELVLDEHLWLKVHKFSFLEHGQLFSLVKTLIPRFGIV